MSATIRPSSSRPHSSNIRREDSSSEDDFKDLVGNTFGHMENIHNPLNVVKKNTLQQYIEFKLERIEIDAY